MLGTEKIIPLQRRCPVDDTSQWVNERGCGAQRFQCGQRLACTVRTVGEDDESTGRFLGEGFDDSRLDTLFLVSPISWKGTLAQYVGRLHREHEGKCEVRVYDYVDANVPVLARMAARRRAGYKALGYTIE